MRSQAQAASLPPTGGRPAHSPTQPANDSASRRTVCAPAWKAEQAAEGRRGWAQGVRRLIRPGAGLHQATSSSQVTQQPHRSERSGPASLTRFLEGREVGGAALLQGGSGRSAVVQAGCAKCGKLGTCRTPSELNEKNGPAQQSQQAEPPFHKSGRSWAICTRWVADRSAIVRWTETQPGRTKG